MDEAVCRIVGIDPIRQPIEDDWCEDNDVCSETWPTVSTEPTYDEFEKMEEWLIKQQQLNVMLPYVTAFGIPLAYAACLAVVEVAEATKGK